MEEWEKFNGASLLENRGCKKLGEYHDLYLKSGTLLLADVFENFRKTCSSPRICLGSSLKSGSKIRIFN